MQREIFKNLTFFDDEFDKEWNKSIQLNKSLLLDILNHLRTSSSIIELRKDVLNLKNQLQNHNSKLYENVGSDNMIEFTLGYLMDELEQIIDSHTLERALYYVERFIK